MSRRAPRLAIVASGLALLASACDKRVDHVRAEDLVRSSMRSQGLELTKVTCPEGVAMRAGVTFQCTGKDDEGNDGTFEVTIQADQTFSLQLRERYVDEAAFGAQMAKRIADETGRKVEVRCANKRLIVHAGVRFSCALREGSTARTATFTYKDDVGAMDLKVE